MTTPGEARAALDVLRHFLDIPGTHGPVGADKARDSACHLLTRAAKVIDTGLTATDLKGAITRREEAREQECRMREAVNWLFTGEHVDPGIVQLFWGIADGTLSWDDADAEARRLLGRREP
ncbi:hypothetical protein F5972_08670 [Microbispora cellulosiformans]|uniref:Uncharacterized protein n=1 Tax=Microbispora cellulosiformans TaxID=2614688 RepID=A0A5J5K7P3_9ACTN|nr:hypothetical protein [Microbispora cellulosiformans]KAA9379714.1 hypothetical protein F5972_08670 [Microbispora cellulosiformans]